jgi:hypothetical protein
VGSQETRPRYQRHQHQVWPYQLGNCLVGVDIQVSLVASITRAAASLRAGLAMAAEDSVEPARLSCRPWRIEWFTATKYDPISLVVHAGVAEVKKNPAKAGNKFVISAEFSRQLGIGEPSSFALSVRRAPDASGSKR